MGTSVEVRDLQVVARTAAGESPIVRGISFTIRPGEVLALIGESGSGKTTTALALMGYAREGCRIAGGSIRIGNHDVLKLGTRSLREFRGLVVSYVAQSAAASFDPSRSILDQVIEPVVIHGVMSRAKARQKAVGLFRELALPQPEVIGSRYPHQVSGGQLQRMMAAMALINDPDVVIFDEPTTALDVTTQIEVLRAFRSAIRGRDTTAVYVSHDLAVVAQMADQILVMRDGAMQELGEAQQVIHAPKSGYTAELLAAIQTKDRVGMDLHRQGKVAPLLEIRNLNAGYGPIGTDGMPAIPVLRNISLTIRRGEAIGVIGESGSGKTTLAGVISGLVSPCSGELVFEGAPLPKRSRDRQPQSLRRIQMVFQMAETALNPRHTVGRTLARPLAFYHGLSGPECATRVFQLLEMVRLPRGLVQRLPGELSGGQRQRVNLARALAAEPDLILCDEVTSALDTVVGAAILDLIADLRRELNVSFLFISHDLKTVRSICDQIVVMRQGEILSTIARRDYSRSGLHPYYDLLSQSVPELRRDWLDAIPVR